MTNDAIADAEGTGHDAPTTTVPMADASADAIIENSANAPSAIAQTAPSAAEEKTMDDAEPDAAVAALDERLSPVRANRSATEAALAGASAAAA